MVKIRLAQTGAKNRRQFRIVAIEEGKRRDGRTLEVLGHYNPLVAPAHFSVTKTRVNYWLSVGAQLSPAVKELLDQA